MLTPHAGEFARLAGEPPGDDRVGATRKLAEAFGATVLLKGNVTVIAAPDGTVYLNPAGASWAATAGSGDVLSGMIGALLAAGLPAVEGSRRGRIRPRPRREPVGRRPRSRAGAHVGVAHPRPHPLRPGLFVEPPKERTTMSVLRTPRRR